MKTGSIYIKNPSILYLSGANIGEALIVGQDYIIEYMEEERKK